MRHKLSKQQRRTLDALSECRTSALGGHVDVCGQCGREQISYNSCRNRHCPKCGGMHQLEWQQARNKEMLPIPYFHVIFTIDHDLNAVVGWNEAAVYNILFEAAWGTVKAYGDKTFHAETGMLGVLHTWGQTLQQHVHLHTVVMGGGLRKNGTWRRVGQTSFLFPAEAFSEAFRDRFCKLLLERHGELKFGGASEAWSDKQVFGRILAEAKKKKWEVFLKAVPTEVGQTALDYLARYINKVAITNRRIVGYNGEEVKLSYKDYRDEGKQKEMSVPAKEFLERFVRHILPKGFVRCRYFGVWARAGLAQRLKKILDVLGAQEQSEHATRQKASGDWFEQLHESILKKAQTCEACGGPLQRIRDLSPPSLIIRRAA